MGRRSARDRDLAKRHAKEAKYEMHRNRQGREIALEYARENPGIIFDGPGFRVITFSDDTDTDLHRVTVTANKKRKGGRITTRNYGVKVSRYTDDGTITTEVDYYDDREDAHSEFDTLVDAAHRVELDVIAQPGYKTYLQNQLEDREQGVSINHPDES